MRFLLCSLVLVGCGGAQSVLLDDAGGAVDAGGGGPDATSADASSNDAAAPVDAAKPDSGGSGLAFKCGDNVVTDCAQCPSAPQPCVYCSTTSKDVTGACTALHANCIGAIPPGFQDCPCANGQASACLEPYQICNQTSSCHTCSDATGNDGRPCMGGGTCNASTGTCQ